MTDRAPTEREPRTDLLDIAERLRAVAHFESFGDAPNGDFVMFDKDDALALLAAASPSCSSCHHPIHDFGDVGECPCGCIENPATETGGLDPNRPMPSVQRVSPPFTSREQELAQAFREAVAQAHYEATDHPVWPHPLVEDDDYNCPNEWCRRMWAMVREAEDRARLRSSSVGEGSGKGETA